MALPNPSMSFSPFAILTAEEMNDLVENIEALSDGSGLEDGAVATAKYADGSVTPEKRSGGFATGSFTQVTNGTLVISGVTGFNFMPKILRFTAAFHQPVASSNNASTSVGFYNVAQNQNTAISTAARNGQGSGGGYLSTSDCIRTITVASGGAGASSGNASVTAVGVGTFTLTFANVAAPGVQVIWEAQA